MCKKQNQYLKKKIIYSLTSHFSAFILNVHSEQGVTFFFWSKSSPYGTPIYGVQWLT